jgi:pimeloyl-ACP methyl ester carboxylesterase
VPFKHFPVCLFLAKPFTLKLKKRYAIATVLCTGLLVTCQMEFLKFRQTEDKQRAFLASKGQPAVHFGTYQVDGRNMHYTRCGKLGQHLLLVVHGSPGSSQDALEYLADTNLTKQALVVAVDRPGLGYSDFGKTERSLVAQAQQLRPLLEKYRTPGKKAILLGHSYGGPLIARMAMDFPELADGLVIVAGSIDPALEPDYWWASPIDWWAIRWMLPPAFRVSNQEILPLKKELEDMLPFWADIRCPVTVVQGTKDSLVPAGNADFAKKMLVNSHPLQVQMLEGEDHFIMWTKAPLIAARVIEMLDEANVAVEKKTITN